MALGANSGEAGPCCLHGGSLGLRLAFRAGSGVGSRVSSRRIQPSSATTLRSGPATRRVTGRPVFLADMDVTQSPEAANRDSTAVVELVTTDSVRDRWGEQSWAGFELRSGP